MRPLHGIPVLGLALLAACGSLTSSVRGRVVDDGGRPVPGAQVSLSAFPTGREEAARPALESDANGEFAGELTFLSRGGHPVLAIDRERKMGGMARFNRRREPVTIVVRPLSRVTGRVSYEQLPKPIRDYQAEGRPFRSIYIGRPPTEPREGIQGDPLEYVAGGKLDDGAIDFLLPPGEYTARIMGYHEMIFRNFTVDGSGGPVDLGVLEAKPLAGHEIYGGPAPDLRFADARGISKEGGLAALKGKWVLLILWDHRMRGNAHWLPSLMSFYNDHPNLRDRFEIVAIHNCDDVLTVQELERARAWDVGHSDWTAIPFPVGIDFDEKTFNAYGMIRGRRSSPRKFLITPEGVVYFDPAAYDPVRFLKSKLGVE